MRLIDKDRCKADIEQFNRPLCDDYHMKDYVLNQIITDIENQPTVDAVPVRHRKWISNSPVTMRCNKCTYVASDWIVHEYHYCPNCGARMDEE